MIEEKESMEPAAQKSDLRRAALAQRRALPGPEAERRSEVVADLLFQHFPVAAWRWLHLFLPITRLHEPDTWLIIRRIWAKKLPVRLAVPVVQPDGLTLKHYELTPDTPLHENSWGISEPVAPTATEVFPAAFDAVLVPLLAVDEAGHRVGYGGGYYDRFLAQCRPKTPLIGLTILTDSPHQNIADLRPTDVPLHACLTPDGVRRFGKQF